ncbi:hypothetical protein KI387_014856, partial [Taxus chinensis]
MREGRGPGEPAENGTVCNLELDFGTLGQKCSEGATQANRPKMEQGPFNFLTLGTVPGTQNQANRPKMEQQ